MTLLKGQIFQSWALSTCEGWDHALLEQGDSFPMTKILLGEQETCYEFQVCWVRYLISCSQPPFLKALMPPELTQESPFLLTGLLLQTNSVRAVTEAVMLTGTGPASCTVEGWGDETCPEQFCSSKCFSFLSERTCAGYSIDQQTPVLTGRCQEGIHYTSVFIDKPWIPCDYEVIKGI